MKFRAKIKTPWCEKGKIYMAHTYAPGRITFSPNDIPFGYQCVDHPEDYPDLFEPVEEKSNVEKWDFILSQQKWYRFEIDEVAQYLNKLGLDADKIYKEVCGEG